MKTTIHLSEQEASAYLIRALRKEGIIPQENVAYVDLSTDKDDRTSATIVQFTVTHRSPGPRSTNSEK